MKLRVKITNFGKLDKTELEFKDLTFFAGTNNLGKSYVSRVLYSIFSAITVNPLSYYYEQIVRVTRDDFIRGQISFLNKHRVSSEEEEFFTALRKIDRLIRVDLAREVKGIFNADEGSTSDILSGAIEDISADIRDKASSSFMGWLNEAKSTLAREMPQQNKRNKQLTKDYSAVLEELANEIKHKLEMVDEHIIKQAYAEIIREKLLKNFQAEEVTDLVGKDKKQDATVSITFLEAGNDSIQLVISPTGEIKKMDVKIINPQAYSDAVYLESPLYWKMKDKLTSDSLDIFRREQYLSGVPQYFLEVVEKIKLRKITKSNGDTKFRDELLADLEDIIGGKIIRDPNSEELLFAELESSGKSKNKSYKKGISLLLTATGIVQYAMLAYLIERKIIDRGATLFLDEPEVHLHPEWQESITESLYQLSKHGVNVVIATHSPIIMQKLELCLEEDEDVKDDDNPEEVALNYFSPDGKFATSKESFKSIRRKIMKSLEGPASRMYIKQM